MRAMDGRIVRCGIISSCQSAATSEVVKRFWSRSHVRSAITSIATFTFTFYHCCVGSPWWVLWLAIHGHNSFTDRRWVRVCRSLGSGRQSSWQLPLCCCRCSPRTDCLLRWRGSNYPFSLSCLIVYSSFYFVMGSCCFSFTHFLRVIAHSTKH